MKKYEGLFILNLSGKEEGAKEALDKISTEITNVGGKVETVQKMDRKAFARVADKRHEATAMPMSFSRARPRLCRSCRRNSR